MECNLSLQVDLLALQLDITMNALFEFKKLPGFELWTSKTTDKTHLCHAAPSPTLYSFHLKDGLGRKSKVIAQGWPLRK
jgi:hypothetical protein